MGQETINDRLEMLINELFAGNKSAFAKKIGQPPTGLSNYIGNKRRSKPSVDMIRQIVESLGVSAHWLITGEGDHMQSLSNSVNTGDFSPVNVNGNMEVRQTSMSDKRELELLRATIADKERTIQIQQQLIEALRAR